MRVLVCGGAGYIGAHVCLALVEAGHNPVVLDNLSTGHAAAVAGFPLYRADIGDEAALADIFARERFDAVIHLAALSVVADSMRQPGEYHRVNVGGSRMLCNAMHTAGVKRMVFSSSASVYGMPLQDTIAESHPCTPINPYGQTKLEVERLLIEQASSRGLASVSLRYFNAAGADPGGRAGESHDPETHLIPNVIRGALGQAPAISIFGTDYPTPDGTCIRDYVHVCDLARAHVLALDFLATNQGAHAVNLGSGSGCSVRQIIDALAGEVGAIVPTVIVGRREGDPPRLVAGNELALQMLQWKPQCSDLPAILRSAWAWHSNPRY